MIQHDFKCVLLQNKKEKKINVLIVLSEKVVYSIGNVYIGYANSCHSNRFSQYLNVYVQMDWDQYYPLQLHVMDGCLSITPLKIPRPSYLSFVDLAIIEEKEKVG